MLLLLKSVSKKKSPFIDVFNKKDLALNKRYLASINKATKMPDKSKDRKMPNIRHILPKNKNINSSQSKLEI